MNLLSGGISWSDDPISDSLSLQQEAADLGFDWKQPIDVVDKLREEVEELQVALREDDVSKISHELGDLFLALINVARLVELDPGDVVQSANERFLARFQMMRTVLDEQHRLLEDSSHDELNRAWNAAKLRLLRN